MLNLSVSRNLQNEITEEYAKVFTSISSRIEVFQTTQGEYVNSLVEKIKQHLNYEDREIRNLAALYGICLTDESLVDYDVTSFVKDVNYLSTIIPSSYNTETDEKEIEESNPVSEEITQPEQIEEKQIEVKGRSDLKPIPKKFVQSINTPTWQERTSNANKGETPLVKVLSAYYQANIFNVSAINLFIKDLILHNVNERIPLAISSILIREHLIPLIDHIYQLYKSSGVELDLRYAIAHISYGFKGITRENLENISIFDLYENLSNTYPLSSGDDLYWDLTKSQIFEVYYDKVKLMVQPQIDEAIKQKKESKEASQNLLNVKQPRQGATESLRANVDRMIFEAIHFNRPFMGEQRIKAKRLIETILRRRALEEFGKQDIPHMEKYREYFLNDFFYPIMKEYPQFLVLFIDVRYYKEFTENPQEHFEKNREYIMNQFWFRMNKMGYVPRANSTQIANAFAGLLQEILNDPRVKALE